MTIRLFVALLLATGCAQASGRKATVPDASPGATRGPGALSIVEVGADAQPAPLVAPDAGTVATDALPAVVADTLPTALDTLPAATPDAWAAASDVFVPAPGTPDALPKPDAWRADDGPVPVPANCSLLQVKTGLAPSDFCEGYWPSSPPLLCATSCRTLDPAHPRMVYDDPTKGCYSQRVMSDGNTSYVVCLPSADLCATYCPKK